MAYKLISKIELRSFDTFRETHSQTEKLSKHSKKDSPCPDLSRTQNVTQSDQVLLLKLKVSLCHQVQSSILVTISKVTIKKYYKNQTYSFSIFLLSRDNKSVSNTFLVFENFLDKFIFSKQNQNT